MSEKEFSERDRVPAECVRLTMMAMGRPELAHDRVKIQAALDVHDTGDEYARAVRAVDMLLHWGERSERGR